MVAAYEPVWKDVVDCCIILWYPLWVGSYPQLLLFEKKKKSPRDPILQPLCSADSDNHLHPIAPPSLLSEKQLPLIQTQLEMNV